MNSGHLCGDLTFSSIRRILVELWDPIGVGDTPEVFTEYESFIGNIFKMLTHKTCEVDLVDFLCVSEKNLGLSPNFDRNEEVAAELLRLR